MRKHILFYLKKALMLYDKCLVDLLMCFSPTPRVRWDYEEEGHLLPIGRYEHPSETTLRIWDIAWEDQGSIVCKGTNDLGSDTARIAFDVQGQYFTYSN